MIFTGLSDGLETHGTLRSLIYRVKATPTLTLALALTSTAPSPVRNHPQAPSNPDLMLFVGMDPVTGAERPQDLSHATREEDGGRGR